MPQQHHTPKSLACRRMRRRMSLVHRDTGRRSSGRAAGRRWTRLRAPGRWTRRTGRPARGAGCCSSAWPSLRSPRRRSPGKRVRGALSRLPSAYTRHGTETRAFHPQYDRGWSYTKSMEASGRTSLDASTCIRSQAIFLLSGILKVMERSYVQAGGRITGRPSGLAAGCARGRASSPTTRTSSVWRTCCKCAPSADRRETSAG